MKKGTRYMNNKGEYCIIKSIYKNIIKLQVCGDKARIEPYKREDFIKELKTAKLIEVPFPKTVRSNVARHLLEYQLNIIGKTTADTKKNENWFKEWHITVSEHHLFKQYAINVLKKVFKFNRTKAESTFNWFNELFGLTLIEDHKLDENRKLKIKK